MCRFRLLNRLLYIITRLIIIVITLMIRLILLIINMLLLIPIISSAVLCTIMFITVSYFSYVILPNDTR